MTVSITTFRRRNFQGLIITIIIALVATAAINLVIDPYGVFRFVNIAGLNQIKPYPGHDLETIKAHALRHLMPDALILGNSRAEVGFDPTHSAWRKAGYQSIYNAAIAGAGTQTAVDLLEHAAQVKPPKLILLGIDFFDFPIAPHANQTQPPSKSNPRLDNARWILHATLTMQALFDSATTLRRQYQTNPEQLTNLGHNPLLEYQDIAKADGYWALFRQRAEENAKNHGRRPKNLYLQGTRSSPSFENVRHIVRWATRNNAELRLIVYPYHGQLLVLIDELGLWPLFEEWKRRIVDIIEEEGGPTQANIVLIDFSGFSAYTTEQIPSKNDKRSSPQWYWEAGHFKKELGNVMLNTAIRRYALEGSSTGFGTELHRSNIDHHLAALRSAKDHFRQASPELVADVHTMVQRTE